MFAIGGYPKLVFQKTTWLRSEKENMTRPRPDKFRIEKGVNFVKTI